MSYGGGNLITILTYVGANSVEVCDLIMLMHVAECQTREHLDGGAWATQETFLGATAEPATNVATSSPTPAPSPVPVPVAFAVPVPLPKVYNQDNQSVYNHKGRCQ